jgi:hypothetical protein
MTNPELTGEAESIDRIARENETTPETVLQGYLAGRWKRRHGDIYRPAAAPWYPFEADPGWTGNTIRYRIMNIGGDSTLQVIGDIQAPLGSQSVARIGVLPTGFRPAQAWYRTAGIVQVGLTYSWASFEIRGLAAASDPGAIMTVWGIGSPPTIGMCSINAIVPMDVYSAAALQGVSGAIAGGDDNQAKVDVPSGAPRV